MSSSSSFDKISFYYLNKSAHQPPAQSHSQQRAAAAAAAAAILPSPLPLANNATQLRMCTCATNYPIEMIFVDDSSPSWPMAATSSREYFYGAKSANVKGLFCYSTSNGELNCIDMRTRTKAFEVRRDMRRGYVTAMCTDPWYTWLAAGTSCGHIELYDFRFMVPPLQTFEHRSRTSVVRLCNHPTLLNRLCASYQANNEICIWNMAASSSQGRQRYYLIKRKATIYTQTIDSLSTTVVP